MVLELQGADGVGDGLQSVGHAVGIVVHGVDAPGITRTVVVGPADAVHERIPQVHVAAVHVDLGPQHPGAVGELAGPHAAEEVQALLGRAVPEGAGAARHMEVAPVLADLCFRQVADIGLALPDEVLRIVVHEGEVVRGVELTLPVEAQPLHVLADGVHVLHVLLHRVGVVEAQVGGAPPGLRQAEVQADALGVADVQVAVGLRREPREHPPPMLAGEAIRLHDLLDEVEAAGFSGFMRHDQIRSTIAILPSLSPSSPSSLFTFAFFEAVIEAPEFQLGVPEVDEQRHGFPCGLEVVQYLGVVLRQKDFHSFQLNHDRIIHDQICDEMTDQFPLEVNLDRDLSSDLEPSGLQGEEHGALIDRFNKPHTQLTRNFKGGGKDLGSQGFKR